MITLRILILYLFFIPAVVSMFTLPVVYVKHQVSPIRCQIFTLHFDLVTFGYAHDFFLVVGTD